MRSSVRVTGCSPPTAEAASRQRHVERFLAQARLELARLDAVALLGAAPSSSSSLAALSRLPNAGRSAAGSLPRLFQQLGQRAGLAEIARLGLLELRRRRRCPRTPRARPSRWRRRSCMRETGDRTARNQTDWEGPVARTRAGVSAVPGPCPCVRRRGRPWPSRRTWKTPACRAPRCRRAPCDRRRPPPSSARS